MEHFTLKKEERLCSHTVIGKLFSEGESFFIFPFKVVFLIRLKDGLFPAQAAFAVPGKVCRRAVDRNAIKRKMRESYRLNKQILYGELKDHKVSVMFIYLGKEKKDVLKVPSVIPKCLSKLSGIILSKKSLSLN